MITLGMLWGVLTPNSIITIYDRTEQMYVVEKSTMEDVPISYFSYIITSITPVNDGGTPEIIIDLACDSTKYYANGLNYVN